MSRCQLLVNTILNFEVHFKIFFQSNGIYSDPDSALQVLGTHILQTRDKAKKGRKAWPNICYYWKTILTLFMFAGILVGVVVLSVYFSGVRMIGNEGEGEEDEVA